MKTRVRFRLNSPFKVLSECTSGPLQLNSSDVLFSLFVSGFTAVLKLALRAKISEGHRWSLTPNRFQLFRSSWFPGLLDQIVPGGMNSLMVWWCHPGICHIRFSSILCTALSHISIKQLCRVFDFLNRAESPCPTSSPPHQLGAALSGAAQMSSSVFWNTLR